MFFNYLNSFLHNSSSQVGVREGGTGSGTARTQETTDYGCWCSVWVSGSTRQRRRSLQTAASQWCHPPPPAHIPPPPQHGLPSRHCGEEHVAITITRTRTSVCVYCINSYRAEHMFFWKIWSRLPLRNPEGHLTLYKILKGSFNDLDERNIPQQQQQQHFWTWNSVFYFKLCGPKRSWSVYKPSTKIFKLYFQSVCILIGRARTYVMSNLYRKPMLQLWNRVFISGQYFLILMVIKVFEDSEISSNDLLGFNRKLRA